MSVFEMRKSLSILITLVLILSGIQLFFPDIFPDVVKAQEGSYMLRPDGNGEYNLWSKAGEEYNYQEVDEEVSDGATTYVYTDTEDVYDLYTIEDVPIEYQYAPIISATIHLNVSTDMAETAIEICSYDPIEEILSESEQIALTSIYPDYWEEVTWVLEGSFTKDMIDAMQIGIDSDWHDSPSDTFYCTQAWLEVEYGHTPNQTAVYVDDDFTEATPGWNNYSFDNIADAYGNLLPTGTMYVWDGAYSLEELSIEKSITVIGNGSSLVTITIPSEASGWYLLEIENCNFSGMTFISDTGGAIAFYGESIENIDIFSCDFNQTYVSLSGVNCEIYDCNFNPYNNEIETGALAIDLMDSTGCNVSNCSFENFEPYTYEELYCTCSIISIQNGEGGGAHTISHCTFNNSNVTCILMMGSPDCLITYNVFENISPKDDGGGFAFALLYGLMLQGDTLDTRIYYNNFINITNATDEDASCQDNTSDSSSEWDSGSLGNYYSAYDEEEEGAFDVDENDIADDPFPISGSAGAQDNYPKMTPFTGEEIDAPPYISDIEATPNPQLNNSNVNITCMVTDENISLVKINISGPDGFDTTNITMSNISSTNYYYNETYDVVGTYNYYIWAEDNISQSTRSENYTFDITELYTYLYVNTSYDEETPGWGVTRFATIQSAVDVATTEYYFIYVDGDGNVYNENILVTVSNTILFGNYTTTRPSVVGQSATNSAFEIMANNVNVSGFSINNAIGKAAYHGIAVGKTQYDQTEQYNVTILDCYIVQAYYGIMLRGGGYCMVEDTEISGITAAAGIFCMTTHHTINNNYIHNGKIGIDVQYADYAVISNNVISSNNQIGIKLSGAGTNNCSIYRNNLTSNTGYGVSLGNGCKDDCVYNNNFVNNNGVGIQAFDFGSSLRNRWNMSYPVCGNYWDDHDVTDGYSGALQNEVGSDGIVDESGTFDPYVLASGIDDWYPFVGPFNGSYPYVAFFEPGPQNNTPHINVYAMHLDCTVANGEAQPMNVSFYWGNGTLIHMIEDVPSGTEVDLNITVYWNRTITVGGTEYNVTWLAHNTIYYWYINTTYDGTTLQSDTWNFHTSRAYDLNANGAVNYLDVSLFVSHYGLRVIPPGEDSWDINEDTYTNYLDLSSLVSHYGETY
jgi:hypothetical protein